MSVLLKDGTGHFSLIVVRRPGENLGGLASAAQARWNDLPGLRDAAVHLGFGGDELVELMVTDDAGQMRAALAAYGDEAAVLTSGQAYLTRGPDQPDEPFSLTIDAASPRPVLLSIMHCAPVRRDEMFDYLMSSAERFRAAFGGWIGASLFQADSGAAIFEYLQFESPDAMMALQGLAIIEEHKQNLLAFGEMNAAVVMPVATWSVPATADARAVA